MKKPLNILSFLLIIFLSSSTLVDARSLPVKTGTRLFCKINLQFTFLIEFKNKLKYEVHNPQITKKSKKGKYYRLGTWENTYSFNNDEIKVKALMYSTDEILHYWMIIDRSTLNIYFTQRDVADYDYKCESVDKITFDNEIEKIKKEIEEHNNLIDEHYKKTNKL